MKKILVAFGAFALAFAATAELDTLITFSTKGPDKYLDGNIVMDGECYALVWTKNGTFAGLNADGSCVDSENNALVLSAPIAKDGKCPPVMYVVKANVAEQYKDGTYGIYLLDTRKVTGVDENGKTTYAVSGLKSDGTPNAVNGYQSVQDGVKSSDGALASTSASSYVTVAQTAPLPADAPKPTIKGIKLVGDKVFLTVSNTTPYFQYNASAGATPDVIGGEKAISKSGADSPEEEVTIVVPKEGDTGFFKVNAKRN